MKRRIQVYLGQDAQKVGTLLYENLGAREHSTFSYDQSWLERSERFALEPALPLVTGNQFHRKTRAGSVFHGIFADTEPDGWAKRVILRDHAKQRQEMRLTGKEPESTQLSSMDFLLAVNDTSRVGAVRFQDENGDFCQASQKGSRSAPPLIELGQILSATHAVETSTETASDLAYLQGRGTSLGGMRPKCTVVDEDGYLSIGKFPSVQDERAVTKGEILAMRLARSAGINAAETRLIDSGGVPVALIRRFDRTEDGKRLLYISAATLLGIEPDDSQNHFYTEIVDAIRVHGADTQKDIDELWRRMAFSVLVTNVDDHLHNHGFLHWNKTQWVLAPAFDINPFPDRIRELKTWISEDTGPAATIDGLLSVTTYFRISDAKAKDILRDIEHSLSAWRKEASNLGMTKHEIEQFAEAFEHPERIVAQKAL